MGYFQGGKDKADKAIWNQTCTLLQGLSWARDRIIEGDYRGEAAHPIDDPSANVASCIQDLLWSPVLQQRAQGDGDYDRLHTALAEAHDDLSVQPITAELVADIIRNIRASGIFKEIHPDQEVPPYQEYTPRELYGGG